MITQGGCTDISSCYNVTTIGINENNGASAMMIYPNPTKGTVMVHTGGSTGTIVVSNMLGRVVVSQKIQDATTIIGLSSFESGIFCTNVETPTFKEVSRVVKN